MLLKRIWIKNRLRIFLKTAAEFTLFMIGREQENKIKKAGIAFTVPAFLL
jgi:hypothetical protein